MAQIEVTLEREDAIVRSRLLKIRVHEKRLITPVRSLCLSSGMNSESRVLRANSKVRGVNELPNSIDKAKLEDIDNDNGKQEEFYRGIRYRFGGIDTSSELTSFVFTYSNKGREERNREPTSHETEYLAGMLNHPLNDIWVPPIIPQLPGKSYVTYLKDFFEQVNTYQKIAYAGLIPHIARLEIRQLADFYLRTAVNYFVMDFAGRHPLDLVGNINQVMRMVNQIEHEHGVTCFLHAANVPMTRAHWNTPVVPAKDILLFELGFNCFGSSHIPRRLPAEVAQMLQARKAPPRLRLFSRKDYAYFTNDVKDLEQKLQETGTVAVDFNRLRSTRDPKIASELGKCFNVERHGLEANEIRTKLIEKESVAEYIQKKTHVPPAYVKKVLRVGK